MKERDADHHGREGEAIAFNAEVERWCDLQESTRGTSLRRIFLGKKPEYVGVFFALVNSKSRLWPTHLDVYSFLHESVLNHEENKTLCKLF